MKKYSGMYSLKVRLHIKRQWNRQALWVAVCFLVLFFSACSSLTGDQAQQTATSAAPRVNGFGTVANHVHSLLSLPNNVLVLATHYGLFRSTDSGQHWDEVAAGSNQLMDGMMTFSLVNSPLDTNRLYVLTQPSINDPKGIQGLYTSADQGKSWKLAAKKSAIGDMFFVAPGNATAEQVYVYVPSLGARGLKVSTDGGEHFSSAGTLPFGRILGMLAIPNQHDQLLVYSNDGVARSTDGGQHWDNVQGVDNAVYAMTTPGPNSPIYAAGDAGIYVSQDEGKIFKLVYSKSSYGSLQVSHADSRIVYGRTSRAIFKSVDGGQTWSTMPALRGNLENLAPDLQNANQLYLALSYPTEVYHFNQSSASWTSLTPKP